MLKSHLEGDDDRFFSVAMQVAAHEAKVGHGKLAQELRSMIDDAKGTREVVSSVSLGGKRGELSNILQASYPQARLGDMILGDALAEQLRRVIREHRYAGRILENGLSPRRKLLLMGPPGTGKTLTSAVLAGELGFPLLQVRLDGLITKYMGETAAKLRQIFDATSKTQGVYFFDEFDAIGSRRGLTNDVGEMRRVLNSFLLMIEQDSSRSLVVAATNQPSILDSALFRRFDDVLEYALPDISQIADLLEMRLGGVAVAGVKWEDLAASAAGLSYAEVTQAADEVLKAALICERSQVNEDSIRKMIAERSNISERLRAHIA